MASKAKINNSYDTEPSSSSASSASEGASESHHLDEHLVNLPDLLRPRMISDAAKSPILSAVHYTDSHEQLIKDLIGSQESVHGFVNRIASKSPKTHSFISGEPLQNQYFSLITAEDSCNAVDMELSTKECTVKNSGEPSQLPLTDSLSFNGKIKTLSQTNDTGAGPSDFINTSANESFKYRNEASPDLFGDDDDEEDEPDVPRPKTEIELNTSDLTENGLNETNDDLSSTNFAKKREKELIKRIQSSLSGVPPPPSLTIPQLNMFDAILNNKETILSFCRPRHEEPGNGVMDNEDWNPLFKPSHSFEEVVNMEYDEVYKVNHHGICYNVSNTSEKIELLSLSVVDRYVGAETASSYRNSPSSAKKRNQRLKMLTQSPGSRLSHLAKRRSIFSSANLQSKLVAPTGGRQILLDSKKTRNKRKGGTPKRRTPASKKKIGRKTPSSSARKRIIFRSETQLKPGPSRETSKRALFQSPPKHVQRVATIPKPQIKPEIATRVEKSKRALFSPDRSSQTSLTGSYGDLSQMTTSQSSLFGSMDNLLKRKRNSDQMNTSGEDADGGNNSKLFRPNDDSLTPRALKIKSQSFCIGAGSRNSLLSSSSQSAMGGKSLIRASSDTTFVSSQLAENHKKKLLWAVSQALQTKQIPTGHPKFKEYASILARVLKRIFLEFYQKSNTSTSETMLRLAKKYVYLAMSGKNADEIYFYAKSKIVEENNSSKTKLSGYIAPQAYEERKQQLQRTNSSSLFNCENSMDSFNFSQFTASQQSFLATQNTVGDDPFSQDQRSANNNSAIKLPIQPNKSLQNSSSKSNLGLSALRENVDCNDPHRRSSQKNFTGKDQRNVSPYSSEKHLPRSALKASSSSYPPNACDMKAKRQISFDN